MRIIKVVIAIYSILIAVLSISEIVEYTKNPNMYMLGTESMMDNGRIYFQSAWSFFLINVLQVLLTLFVFFALFFIKKHKSIITGIFLVAMQSLLLFFT